jgi:hypothetical protein
LPFSRPPGGGGNLGPIRRLRCAAACGIHHRRPTAVVAVGRRADRCGARRSEGGAEGDPREAEGAQVTKLLLRASLDTAVGPNRDSQQNPDVQGTHFDRCYPVLAHRMRHARIEQGGVLRSDGCRSMANRAVRCAFQIRVLGNIPQRESGRPLTPALRVLALRGGNPRGVSQSAAARGLAPATVRSAGQFTIGCHEHTSLSADAAAC